MENSNLINRNIIIYYYFQFFRSFILAIPIWTLFLKENGLSMTQVLILTTLMIVSQQILQIPTGVFADMYGRKKSVFIGILLFFISYIILSFSNIFYYFIIAYILAGISFSFISGALQALVYDSLFDLNKKNEFMNVESHAFFFNSLAISVAALFGGYVASFYGLRMTYYLTLIPIFLALIIALFFYEPKHHIHKEKEFINSHKKAFYYCISDKKIIGLIFYLGINMALMLIFFNFLQVYLKTFNISYGVYGLLYSIFLIFSALCSKYTYKIEKIIGEKNSILLNPLLLVIALLIIVFSNNFILAIIAILFFEFVWGFINPLVSSYLNNVLHTDYRATILSFAGFVLGGLFLILGPLVGWINDNYSLTLVFWILTILSVISLIISFFIIKNHKNER